MKKLITTFFALIAMLALVSPLYAADDYRTGTSFLSAEELEGMKVVSQTGEEIGEIESVKVDHQSGEIKFVTISTGIGEETAVPFEAIRVDQHNERATLTVNENKLDNAPEQANMSDDEFHRNLESHYGIAPAWQGDSNQIETDPSRSTEENQLEEENPLETEPFKPTGLSRPGRYY